MGNGQHRATPAAFGGIWSVFVIGFLCLSAGATQRTRRNVLLLNSYHPGDRWCDQLTAAIRAELESAPVDVEIHVEYLDMRRYSSSTYLQKVAQALLWKHPKGHFDVLIAADDDAYHFLLEYRDTLFPGCPSVFCGVADFEFSQLEGRTGITGILETADIGATIDVAKALFPRTTHVVVIHDDTPTGRGFRQECERQVTWLRRLHPRIRVSYYSGADLSTEELLARVHRLPRATVALLTSWVKGRDGVYVSEEQFVPELSRTCSVPLFGTSDIQQSGIVGGKLISAGEQGRTAARMALRILDGTPASSIPVRMRSVNRYIFDYRQLQRWRISVDRLPTGSRVIHRPGSFYGRYRRFIWLGLVFIVVESCIIMLLAVNIVQRRRLESQRLELEKRMEQTRKMEGLGVLAGGIAHDFNNLLTVILGNADLLSMDESVDPSQREVLADIMTAARQGEKLAREMLAYSGRVHFELAPASLNDLVSQSARTAHMEGASGARVSLDLAPGLPLVHVDAVQMKRVIFNLLSNALEAVSGGGGTVRVATSRAECSRAYLDSLWLGNDRPEGVYVTLTVEDEGAGIEGESLEHIFDPFYTTKFTGRGLGLAAVYGIMRRHDGCIRALSNEGKGTEITIFLPALESAAESDAC